MNRAEKLIRILADSSWRTMLLQHGVAAGAEHRSALAELNFNAVIDIGANRGQFSLLAKRLFPGARILSFEPLPDPARRYERVFLTDPNVSLHVCAIGDVAGELEMRVSSEDDSSSLREITEAQTKTFPGTGEVGRVKVAVKRLSDVLEEDDIQPPALLKLDVQGYELNALKGSESLLHCFDCVYCECSFVELYRGQALADEVIAWLHERGFSMTGIYNTAYDRDGKAVQADFLFKRR